MQPNVFEDLLGVLAEEHRLDVQSVRTEALRLYLDVNPSLKLEGSVLLWLKGRISLTEAAGIAGLTVPEFKQVLAGRGISRETASEAPSLAVPIRADRAWLLLFPEKVAGRPRV